MRTRRQTGGMTEKLLDQIRQNDFTDWEDFSAPRINRNGNGGFQ
jgi:hypothetical protein